MINQNAVEFSTIDNAFHSSYFYMRLEQRDKVLHRQGVVKQRVPLC